jgi:ribonuclease R/exosome complex exonuclease DIS3/RRP44
MEELATKAERSSIKLMQVKYMSKRINEKFDAVVSGLNERGVFVEIKENKCEGLVRMKDIPNDYFIYDQRNTCVVGQHTHEEYCLGDEVVIKVIGTDLDRKHIDFKILEKK